MVGLPFPNPHDVELKERMQHIGLTAGGMGEDKPRIDAPAGQEYLEDLCMKVSARFPIQDASVC